jgi:hypothetical protein
VPWSWREKRSAPAPKRRSEWKSRISSLVLIKYPVTDNSNSPRDAGETANAPGGDAIHRSLLELAVPLDSEAGLSEDQTLSLLRKTDQPARFIDQISKNSGLMKSRKVQLGMISHPSTPRHISLPLLRHLFTFDLMRVGLTTGVAADIKKAADEVLITRLPAIPSGERLSLAKRGSSRIAAELLLDPEPRIVSVALGNPRLTEALVIKALVGSHARAELIEAVCRHTGWSARREVRAALLRKHNMALAQALEFAGSFAPSQLRAILEGSRLSAEVKSYLLSGRESTE